MIPGFLGIDAGGTSTRAVIVRSDGTGMAWSRQAGGNPTSRGTDQAVDAIVAAAREVLSGNDIEVVSCELGMAGEREKIDVRALAAASGLRAETIHLVSDVVAMYFSGAHEPVGTAVIAGTGSVAARIEDGVLAEVAGGAGWLIGDAGSGFWIGQHVIQAVVADLSGLAPPTSMTPEVLGTLEALDPAISPQENLVRASYAASPVQLSQLAPIAFAQADRDVVARQVLDQAGEHLAALVGRFPSEGPLVLGGSVMTQGFLPRLERSQALGEALRGRDLRVVRNGCAGAAFLALRRAGLDNAATHERVRATSEGPA